MYYNNSAFKRKEKERREKRNESKEENENIERRAEGAKERREENLGHIIEMSKWLRKTQGFDASSADSNPK